MTANLNILPKLIYLTVFLYFSYTSSTIATNYYIDYQNGNDNSSGNSIQTPFKHSPGDPAAIGNAATIILQPGDSIIFKGGIEYLGQILINRGGNSLNNIVYIGNTGWGSGRAIINLQFIRQYAFKGNSNFIIIKGFNIFNYPSFGSDFVIHLNSGVNNWIIEECTIAFIQDWDNVNTFPSKASIQFSNSVSYITIRNCEFFANGKTTIRIRYASKISILNNDFGGINRGDSTGWFSVAIRGEVSSNQVIISGNKFHDNWQYGGDINPELNHAPAAIHIYGSENEYPRDYIIERNYFYNDRRLNTGTGSGSIEITTNCRKFQVRNNLIVNDNQWWGGAIFLSNNADSIWVENNSIFNRDYLTPTGANINLVIYTDELNSVGDSIWIRNNIFWNDDERAVTNVRFTGSPSSFRGILDYNAYFKRSNGYVYSSALGSGNFSELQSYGFESNGMYFEVPNYGNGSWLFFENIPLSPTNSSLGDYKLSAFAPTELKSNGYDCSARFSNDFNGILRNTIWSIGAFQYSNQNIGDMIPPEVISATLLDSITLNIVFSEPLEQSGAINPSNYQIDNGIQVNDAQLFGSTVRLQTSVHTPGFYVISVNNVTDTAGNVISAQNNTANYGYNPDPSPGVLKFTPTGTNASSIPEPEHLPEKTFDGLGYNSGDPTSRWAGNNLPQWIGYDLGYAIMLNKTRIQFYKWNEGRIYTYSIMVSTDSTNWTSVKQNILSSNTEWTEENFEPVPARYIRIIVHSNNQNDWASLWETEFYGQLIVSGNEDNNIKPADFSLEQNYPNPFNPVTKIGYTIPGNVETRRGVSLRVYDILGNEIATLVDEYRQAGRYEVEFDASNLTSGVYIYRLQAGSYVNTKKMILLR